MTDINSIHKELDEIKKALDALKNLPALKRERESQKLKKRQSILESQLTGSGAIAQGESAQAVGENGVLVGGNLSGDIVKGGIKVDNLTIYRSVKEGDIEYDDNYLNNYLNHIIANHRHLRLQGIPSAGRSLSIPLENIFIPPNFVDQNPQVTLKLPQRDKSSTTLHGEGDILSLNESLERNRHLVILGDPGSGKSTLLSYLTIMYADDLLNKSDSISCYLLADDISRLPIYIHLRHLGEYIQRLDSIPGQDGPVILLDYLTKYFSSQLIKLPNTHFTDPLEQGSALILLDGLDEVTDIEIRQRISRMVEKFVTRYPSCRYIVTCRTASYSGPTRIARNFGLMKIQNFNHEKLRDFIRKWFVTTSKLAKKTIKKKDNVVEFQTQELISAIESNRRLAELAVNPLLLTVMVLVHGYRKRLPKRRADLYEEALFVLIDSWNDSKEGVSSEIEINGIRISGQDRRNLLKPIALWMHEQRKYEIEFDTVFSLLAPNFNGDTKSTRALTRRFLKEISEQSGLLIEQHNTTYKFAHIAFQEYLAAQAVAERDDYLTFTLDHIYEPWWQDVILLEVGYLAAHDRSKVNKLLRAIMDADPGLGPDPYHHILLVAECIYDIGLIGVHGNLVDEVRQRLQETVDIPIQKDNKASVLNAVAATNALARIERSQFISQYWSYPNGEPQWMHVPAGKFWMGDNTDEYLYHKVKLPSFYISCVPITNAQYEIFIIDTGRKPPGYWHNNNVPKGMENHPVVDVTWFEAVKYCEWLSRKTNKTVKLPSEAQWEKAARGDKDKRYYPWGDWKKLKCNCITLGLGEATPVGMFLDGASPYGILDMSGNVYEWTCTIWDEEKYSYPYKPDDGREILDKNEPRVLRGGSFIDRYKDVRCASRIGRDQDRKFHFAGFRIVSQK